MERIERKLTEDVLPFDLARALLDLADVCARHNWRLRLVDVEGGPLPGPVIMNTVNSEVRVTVQQPPRDYWDYISRLQ